MRKIRVAVVQIECHPAIFVSHLKYLEEPFISDGGLSLSRLGTKGLPVEVVQRLCIQRYVAWQQERLRGIVAFLGQFDPAPDIALLPEGAVPLEALELISQWSAQHGTLVLAGTHTPRHTPGARRKYAALGIDEQALKRLFKQDCMNAMPIFNSGKAKLVPKRLASIFERSNVSAPTAALPTLRVDKLPNGTGAFLPLICSEALQSHNVSEPYDLALICSYDSRPSQFASYIEQETRNHRVVAYCNDGRYGGSSVVTVHDSRVSDWFRDAFQDGLPPGDSILIVDVDLDATAIEVGTAAPSQAAHLFSLASIVSDKSDELAVAQQLREIRAFEDSSTRAQELKRLLSTPKLGALHQRRIEQLVRLEENGIASTPWWDALGTDCVIPDQPSLRQLEADLAATCVRHLMDGHVIQHGARNAELAAILLSYVGECQNRAGTATGIGTPSESPEIQSIVDREREIRECHNFLDSGSLRILEITGLPQIGKSVLIEKAFAQYGRGQQHLRIPLQRTSSAEYIVYSIVRRLTDSLRPPYPDPVGVIRDDSRFAQALRNIPLIILEHADALLERGAWRDEDFPKVLEAIVEQLHPNGAKLIIETSRELPIELSDASIRKRIRVTGLDRARVDAGVSLFEAQLRRVGLDPTEIPVSDKKFVVNRLGGHPAAIALAADTSFAEGLTALLRDLAQLKGFYLHYVERLLARLDLSDTERTILQLLTLARGPLPREALLASIEIAASSDIRNLIALGAIEVTAQDQLEIAGVLRDYFSGADVPDKLRTAFHGAAASALEFGASQEPENVALVLEAEFHSTMIGRRASISTSLSDATLASAQELFDAQKYDDAIRLLQPLLKQRRRRLDVLRLASRIEARRNVLEKAIEYAKEAFTRDPRDTWLLSRLVKDALTQHQIEFAEEIIELADRAGVEDDEIHIARGRIFLRRDNVEGAETAFKRARQLTQRNVWPFFFLGKIYFRLGRLDDAISILHDGEQFAYDNRSRDRFGIRAIKTLLGVVYLFAQRVDLAEPYIMSVHEEKPDGAEEQRAYVALMVTKGEVSGAAEIIDLFRRVRSRGFEERCRQHLIMGQFYEAINDLYHAAQEYRLAHRADMGNVFAMIKAAKVIYRLAYGAYKESADSYQSYVDECADIVRAVLKRDRENQMALEIAHSLRQEFGVSS